jgi:hypothetical protein
MLSYLFVGGQHDGVWRRAGAGVFTHGYTAAHCAVQKIHYFRDGQTKSGQARKNYQHDFPAALPLQREPLSVLAAV